MRILALETSCDETAAAVVCGGTEVHSSSIASSRESFEWSGGVIPEDAARKQISCILPVVHQALTEAQCTMEDIDVIACTMGPGLLGSLLIGTTTARVLASRFKKPLIPVHHTLGHLASPWLDASPTPLFPCLALSASGGHTDLWYRTAHTKGELIGRTKDDAAGEAFDKGAALLGLPYPGGPAISKEAESGDENAFKFPNPLQGKGTLDFSFSGLKTALKYILRDLKEPVKGTVLSDLAASYQLALCRHLEDRIVRAAEHYPDVKEIHLVGGVSANTRLRTLIAETLPALPPRTPTTLSYCTDNAAMIAAAAFFVIEERGLENAAKSFRTTASLPLAAV